MDSLKNIIKFICFFTLLFLAMFLIIKKPESKHNIHTSYKEWAEQIGLYSTKNVKVNCYDGDNSISVGLEYENGITGYKELCDIINKHNCFVEKNPDYFTAGFKITFENSYGENHPIKSVFFNSECNGYAISDYIGGLDRAYTAKIQYMYINIPSADTELVNDSVIEIDIPVIILLSNNSPAPSGDSLEFLKEYKNAEQVIMDFRSIDYNKDEISEYIKKYQPNVEVYSVGAIDGKYCLEKCP